jgi:hypothetical protein
MNALLRATWNWWTAVAVVALFILALGPRLVPRSSEPATRTVADQYAMVPQGSEQGVALELAAPMATKRTHIALPAGAPSLRVDNVLRNRAMARKASVHLIVGDVERALAALTAIGRNAGGDVTKLDDERPASRTERHTADATLVVPANRLESSVRAIDRLGGVTLETIAAEDVTDQLVDNGARLRNLRRTEGDLLKIMDRSGKVGEVLAVENELGDVRDRIERLDAETHALAARVATSEIDLHLEDAATAVVAEPSVSARLANAWHGAWHASRDAAIGLLARFFYLIAFAPYWLTAFAIAGVAVVQTRRRMHGSTPSLTP